jgi:hypothetical protein
MGGQKVEVWLIGRRRRPKLEPGNCFDWVAQARNLELPKFGNAARESRAQLR